MRKIFTSLIAFALLAFGICFFAAPPKADAADFYKPKVKTVKVLIVGSPGVGMSALAESIAAKGLAVQFVRDVGKSDGDGLTGIKAESLIIASKRGILPITTVETELPAIRQKTETRCRSVSSFTAKTFPDQPPNCYGYSGESFSNRTRASPRRI